MQPATLVGPRTGEIDRGDGVSWLDHSRLCPSQLSPIETIGTNESGFHIFLFPLLMLFLSAAVVFGIIYIRLAPLPSPLDDCAKRADYNVSIKVAQASNN